ncbi:tetratricopeptide repeat protein [Saccharothrix yanglingensis]|nr:tetratricopeptide repeat protein [Saccharothrix yanglingensis]
MRELDEVLTQTREHVTRMFAVLSGPGGIGKTALALHWAHRRRDLFTDGQLYVDLAGVSGARPVPPEEALGLFLRSLGVRSHEVPVEVAEQAALYRSLTADRKLLVLLDNAHSAAQVRPLAPNSPFSAVLVTSRNRLTGLVAEGARLLDVGPLAEASALRLLAQVVGRRVEEEPDRAEALVGMCAGLPIAVRVAAARLASRPHWSVRKVLVELSDERRRLSVLSAPELSVQTTFDLSYRALKPAAAALYRRLALHPGREFGASVATSVLDRDDPHALLEELVDENLVEAVGDGRYRFHDLLRLHARAKAGDDEEVRAVRGMVEWYLAAAMAADRVVTPHRRTRPYAFQVPPADVPDFADRREASAWLAEERRNLMTCGAVAEERGWWELSWHLSDVLWPLFLIHKHHRDRLEADERGVRTARRWGDRFGEADMLKRLGMVCTAVRRFDEAETHLRASVAIAEDIEDRRGAADAREALALLHVARGELDEAATVFGELVLVNRDLAARRSLGLVLINLGRVLSGLGRVEEALDALDEATALFRDLAPPDRYNQARVVVAQAEAYLAADDPASADQAARRGLAELTDLGAEQGMAESHEVIAEAAERRGEPVRAAEHWERALRLYTRLGSSRAAQVAARLGVPEGDPEPPAGDG